MKFHRRFFNRVRYQWCKFKLKRRILELHALAMQRAADDFQEKVILAEIRMLQATLDGEPSTIGQIPSAGYK